MPRRRRIDTAGLPFHVLNRAVARVRLFSTDGDYRAFEKVLAETARRIPMEIFVYCLMPNHWHLIVRPAHAGDLSEFMRLLTVTHVQRWHAAHRTAGTGALYQGRFRSFPIENDNYLLTACRYVERNPLRAGLVRHAEEWPWSSLSSRLAGDSDRLLAPWPFEHSRDWLAYLNAALTPTEEAALRESMARGAPFGTPEWQARTASQLGLEFTLRHRGRPRKAGAEGKDSRPLFQSGS
ncbi:MAG: transposase [Deltaproteobacteria bacterium]|nr:transposase [Deltaproteobacteria bacterium]